MKTKLDNCEDQFGQRQCRAGDSIAARRRLTHTVKLGSFKKWRLRQYYVTLLLSCLGARAATDSLSRSRCTVARGPLPGPLASRAPLPLARGPGPRAPAARGIVLPVQGRRGAPQQSGAGLAAPAPLKVNPQPECQWPTGPAFPAP
jgi:hypothetical protein